MHAESLLPLTLIFLFPVPSVRYIEAVAAPIPLTVINSISYSLLDWATNLNNDASPAWVQSVSYGNDECQQTSDEYMYVGSAG
jgi:hypothetical protein